MTNKELIEAVMRLQAILESRATYNTDCTDEEYKSLRNEVLHSGPIKSKLPSFVETCRNLDQFWNYVKSPRFNTYAERRTFLYESFEPILSFLEKEQIVPSNESTKIIMQEIDWDHVSNIWDKALARSNSDPEGAITLAKTLLEDLCKCILDESKISYSNTDSLPTLYFKASNKINLHPSQHSEAAIRNILGVCNSGVAGIGEFRNKYADSHGKGVSRSPPDPHLSKFVVSMSGIIASLMVEKWGEKDT